MAPGRRPYWAGRQLPRAGVRTPSPQPAPCSSQAPRNIVLVWRTRAEGASEKLFSAFGLPIRPDPSLAPLAVALSSGSWRNLGAAALWGRAQVGRQNCLLFTAHRGMTDDLSEECLFGQKARKCVRISPHFRLTCLPWFFLFRQAGCSGNVLLTQRLGFSCVPLPEESCVV